MPKTWGFLRPTAEKLVKMAKNGAPQAVGGKRRGAGGDGCYKCKTDGELTAMQGDTPGTGTVNVYRVGIESDEIELVEHDVTARQTSTTAIASGEWRNVHQDKYGTWWVSEGAPAGNIKCRSTTSISVSGSGTAEIYRAGVASGETITVHYDWMTAGGTSIATNTDLIVYWDEDEAHYSIINAACSAN